MKLNRRYLRKMILQEMAKGFDGSAYNYRKDPNALADMRYAGSELEDMPAVIDMGTGGETYDLDLDDPAVVGMGDMATDEEKRRSQLAYTQATMHDAPGTEGDRERFMADFEDEMVLDRLAPDDRDSYLTKRTNRIAEGRINREVIRKMIYDALR